MGSLLEGVETGYPRVFPLLVSMLSMLLLPMLTMRMPLLLSLLFQRDDDFMLSDWCG